MVQTTIRGLFQQSAQEWLHDARYEAVELLKQRYEITIEDVLSVCPFPKYLRRNLIGQVFRDDVFQPVGYTKAKRPVAHDHVIRVWTINEQYFPEQLLRRRHRYIEEYESDL